MENILQGVANSSSVPQDFFVFVSVCVWDIGEVTTGSSSQPWSTSYSSQCLRTFHVEPFTLKRLRKDCEDFLHTEEHAQGPPPRARVGQGTPEGTAESIT